MDLLQLAVVGLLWEVAWAVQPSAVVTEEGGGGGAIPGGMVGWSLLDYGCGLCFLQDSEG